MKITHLTMTIAVGVVAIASFVARPVTAHAGAQASATKAGWWVKVSTAKTQATSIEFEIGKRERDHEPWRTWNAGDPAEFDLPAAYLQLPRLYFRASVKPAGANAWLCLMFKDHGVKHFEIDQSEAQMKEATDIDEECK